VSEHGRPVDLPTEAEAEIWAVRDDDGSWRLVAAMRDDGRLAHHAGARHLTEAEALEFLQWVRSFRVEP
jgi:hypothetical protein